MTIGGLRLIRHGILRRLQYANSAGFYVGVIVLAIFAPQVAASGYLAIGILTVLRAQGDGRETPDVAGGA